MVLTGLLENQINHQGSWLKLSVDNPAIGGRELKYRCRGGFFSEISVYSFNSCFLAANAMSEIISGPVVRETDVHRRE